MLKSNYEGTATDDYLHVVLTDEDDVPQALGKMRSVYPNIMKLDYDNTRTRNSSQFMMLEDMERKSELQLFRDFFEAQNGKAMSAEQDQYVSDLFEKLREEMI